MNVSAESLNATTLSITWQPPLLALQNGVITGYDVLVNETNTGSTQTIRSVNGLSVTATDLHPVYTYEIQVAAITTGIGPYSTQVRAQLPEASKCES